MDAAVLSLDRPCKVCGAPAEAIELVPMGVDHPNARLLCVHAPAVGAVFARFDGATDGVPIKAHLFARIREAILRGKRRALCQMLTGIVKSFCPNCRCCYCPKHWSVELNPDPYGDAYSMHYIRHATCPAGHEHKSEA